MFNPTSFENSRAGGFGVLQVVDPAFITDDRMQRFVPLKRTAVTGEICGPLASFQVRHAFGYARESCNKVLEACYRFPLPGDAAVTGVRVRFGDVEIVTELKDREQAEADYADAKEAGQQAALLSRESPDVFTLQVAGIRPDEDVIVETEYVQLARVDGLDWTLRFPLTTAPRYVRTDELGSAHARGQPLAVLRDPGHRFSLDIAVRNAVEIRSSTHELEVRPDDALDAGSHVSLAAGAVLPDRDCVLAWQPVQQRTKPGLTLFCQNDVDAGFVYFLALLAPPLTQMDAAPPARETVLLVDHSGSMTGPKWAASDWAVERFLFDLSPEDRFGLCLFHNETAWYGRTLTEGNVESVDKAVAWLKGRRDSGGTNLGVALEEALRIAPAEGERARNVLVITDAQVTDDGRILRLADEEAARSDGKGRRISVLCIDAAPNSYLANQLAERGGGIAKFLTSSPNEDDIATALDGVLMAWGEPVLADLRLTVNRERLEPAGRRLVTSDDGRPAIDLGDLPAGQARWVAGRVPRGDGAALDVRVVLPDGQLVASATADLTLPNVQPQLKTLFGARRLNALEFLVNAGYAPDRLADQLRRLGYDLTDLPAMSDGQVYAETARKETEQVLRGLLVDEALAYHLPSSVTSFVGIRSEAGEPIDETVVVANALPDGWSSEIVAPAVRIPTHMVEPSALRARLRGALPGSDAGVMPIAAGMPAPSMMAAPSASLPGQDALSSPTGPSAWMTLYDADVQLEDSTLVLYDSSDSAIQPPAPTTIRGVRAQWVGDSSDWRQINRTVTLLIYVGDMAAPRARMRLVDLLRFGERPLNLSCQEGQRVQTVLQDEAGYFAAQPAHLVVAVRW